MFPFYFGIFVCVLLMFVSPAGEGSTDTLSGWEETLHALYTEIGGCVLCMCFPISFASLFSNILSLRQIVPGTISRRWTSTRSYATTLSTTAWFVFLVFQVFGFCFFCFPCFTNCLFFRATICWRLLRSTGPWKSSREMRLLRPSRKNWTE